MYRISASQIRAARGLLNWPQKTLADNSGVGVATLRLMEKDDENITVASSTKLMLTFEKAGLEFFENGGVGFRQDSVDVYRGVAAYDKLFEMFETAKFKGEQVNIMCKSWPVLTQVMGLTDKPNLKRFEAITSGMTVNCLLSQAIDSGEFGLPFKFKVLPNLFLGGSGYFYLNGRYILAQLDDCGNFVYVAFKSVGQRQSFMAEFVPLWSNGVPVLSPKHENLSAIIEKNAPARQATYA